MLFVFMLCHGLLTHSLFVCLSVGFSKFYVHTIFIRKCHVLSGEIALRNNHYYHYYYYFLIYVDNYLLITAIYCCKEVASHLTLINILPFYLEHRCFILRRTCNENCLIVFLFCFYCLKFFYFLIYITNEF